MQSLLPFIPIVTQYFDRHLLAKMGHHFPVDGLTDFEVEAYKVIKNHCDKLESEDLKKSSKR
jgi:hypothetical protein